MARILIVDDHPYIRFLVKLVLEPHRHTLVEATDGIQALQLIDGMQSVFELILLDLLMPKLDGYAFLSCLRHRQIHLPVIILTTLWKPAPQILDYPISGHLAKPFTRQKLVAMVQQQLAAQTS